MGQAHASGNAAKKEAKKAIIIDYALDALLKHLSREQLEKEDPAYGPEAAAKRREDVAVDILNQAKRINAPLEPYMLKMVERMRMKAPTGGATAAAPTGGTAAAAAANAPASGSAAASESGTKASAANSAAGGVKKKVKKKRADCERGEPEPGAEEGAPKKFNRKTL